MTAFLLPKANVMKNLILGIFALLCLIACEQEPTLVGESTAPTLVGKWQLVEQNVSDGGPSTWEKVENGTTFRLKADSSFLGFQTFNDCQTGTYDTAADELILTYDCEDTPPFIYTLRKEDEAIILSPKTVVCIEGCAYKYQKIAE